MRLTQLILTLWIRMEKGAPLRRLPFIVIIWDTRQTIYFFLDPDPSHRDTSRCLCVQSIDNKNQKKLSALNKARALNGLDQDIKHEFLSRISKCKHIKILEHSYMTLYFKVTVIAWVVVVVDLYLSQQHFWTILVGLFQQRFSWWTLRNAFATNDIMFPKC